MESMEDGKMKVFRVLFNINKEANWKHLKEQGEKDKDVLFLLHFAKF